MNRALTLVSVLGLRMTLGIANGQDSAAVIAGAGYAPPLFLSAVPGELFTLFVAGLEPDLRRPFFTQAPPLPFEVNGLTVTISHADTSFRGEPAARQDYAVAIHSIRQVGAVTAITIQVPPEIETRQLPGYPYRLSTPINGAIRILHGDNVVTNADLMIWSQRIRVVTSCDFAYQTNQYDGLPEELTYCPLMIFRQDGSYAGNSASTREKVKVLITGLGNLRQPGIRELFKSGWPNPDPPVGGGMTYLRDIGINLGPKQPWRNRTVSGPQPPMLGAPGVLVPGEYGISAIEIEMPELRPVDPECPGNVALYSSNVTVTIGNSTSYDYVRFCVHFSPVGGANGSPDQASGVKK